jgi:hypothetical protein
MPCPSVATKCLNKIPKSRYWKVCSATQEKYGNDFFQDLRLEDEVRLDKIKFSDEADGEFVNLQPLEQAVVLGML